MGPRQYEPTEVPWSTGAPAGGSWRDTPYVTVPAGLAGLYGVYRGGRAAVNKVRGRRAAPQVLADAALADEVNTVAPTRAPFRGTSMTLAERNASLGINPSLRARLSNMFSPRPAYGPSPGVVGSGQQFWLNGDTMYRVQPNAAGRLYGQPVLPEGGINTSATRFVPKNAEIFTRSPVAETGIRMPRLKTSTKGGLIGLAAGVGASIIDDQDWARRLAGRPTREEAAGSDDVRGLIQSRAERNDRSNSIASDVGQFLMGLGGGGDISAPDLGAAEDLYNEGLIKFADKNLTDVGGRGGQFQYKNRRGDDIPFANAVGEKGFGAFELTAEGKRRLDKTGDVKAVAAGQTSSPEQEMTDALTVSRRALANNAMFKGIDPAEILATFDQGVDDLAKEGKFVKDGALVKGKVGDFRKQAAELASVLGSQVTAQHYADQQDAYLQALLPGQVLQAYGEFYAPYAEQYMNVGLANAAEDRLRASEYEPGSPLYDSFMMNARNSELKGKEAAHHLMYGDAMAPFLGAATQSNQNVAKQIQRFVTQQASNSGGGEAVLGEEGAAQDMTQSLMETLGLMDMDIFQGMPSATGMGSLNDYVNFDLYGAYNTR